MGRVRKPERGRAAVRLRRVSDGNYAIANRQELPIAVICPTQKSEAASTYFFGCSLTRVTSWVGLTKRSAMSSQISVVTI